jgi:hypothetical protein
MPVSAATLEDIQTRLQELEQHANATPMRISGGSAVPSPRGMYAVLLGRLE